MELMKKDIYLTRLYCQKNNYVLREYSDYIDLKRGLVTIRLSFGENCLLNSERSDLPDKMTEMENKFYEKTSNSFPTSRFVVYIRARSSDLLDNIMPYDTILQYSIMNIHLIVQYIGYSYDRSSIENVCEFPQKEPYGCCIYCNEEFRYHVIVTKKIKYEKELGYRHFHNPNGLNLNNVKYPILEEYSYCPYVIDNNKVYTERHELFRYGGSQFI